MSRRVTLIWQLIAVVLLVSLILGNWFFDFNHKYPDVFADGVLLWLILMIVGSTADMERRRREDAEKNGEVFVGSLAMKLLIGVLIALVILIPCDLIFGLRQTYPDLHSGIVIFVLPFTSISSFIVVAKHQGQKRKAIEEEL